MASFAVSLRRKIHDLPIIAKIGMTFLLLCLFGVHGFSLERWNALIDGAVTPRVTLFHAQPIRSDDWWITLPSIFSQTSTGFHESNPSFGYPSHDMVLLSGAGRLLGTSRQSFAQHFGAIFSVPTSALPGTGFFKYLHSLVRAIFFFVEYKALRRISPSSVHFSLALLHSFNFGHLMPR
jgi:hypothetical protein